MRINRNRRKEWMNRIGNKATCARCGGVSVFIPGVYLDEAGQVKITYWKWWRGFKKAHKVCSEKKA